MSARQAIAAPEFEAELIPGLEPFAIDELRSNLAQRCQLRSVQSRQQVSFASDSAARINNCARCVRSSPFTRSFILPFPAPKRAARAPAFRAP